MALPAQARIVIIGGGAVGCSIAYHLAKAGERDVVVLTIRLLRGPDGSSHDLEADELFTDYEQTLFTKVVAIAERHGRGVKLLVLPATNIFDAVAQTAVILKASEIVVGASAVITAGDQAHQMGQAWDRTPRDRELITQFVIHFSDGHVQKFALGAHPPTLTPEDVERIHKLWVEAVKALGPNVHHRDIVVAAVIGVAFGNVVSAMVKDLVTPLIGAFGGTPDFSGIIFNVNGSKFMVGDFLNAFISFLAIAAVIFFAVVVPMNKISERTKSGKSEDPTEKICPECLSLIPIKAKRCKFCTAVVGK